VAWRNYDAFGQTRASSGTWASAFGFTGQQDDSVDGTVYMRARAYSPALGRFLQRDSFAGYATAGQTLNRYAYSGNNPATYSDPSGHDFWEDLGKGIGLLNERVGPKAMKRSWNWAQRVGRRVYNDPSIIWRMLTSPCVLDALQTTLDVMGMMPAVGTPFDILNAFVSAGRGNYAEAALNLMFALPGIGDAAAGAKLARKGLGHADEAAGLLRYADDAVEHEGDDLLEAFAGSCLLGKRNSFSGDTLVATPDGDVPISQIQIGDQVLAYNQETGSTGTYTVTDVLVNLDPAQVQLTIDGERIDTTPEHPFYVLLRGWVSAIALHIGDQVRTADGDYGAVEGARLDPTPRLMYNLTVAEAHTFFVGEEGWLVHNATKCSLRDLYLGDTPSKSSATGKRVIDRMMDEGKIRLSENGEHLEVYHPKAGWVHIDETDMGHIHDAVTWWNNVGRFYGPKSPEVRKFMLDPDNYELEPFWINRSKGSTLGKSQQYLPPVQ
jgi:RHS repeat-associated protein